MSGRNHIVYYVADFETTTNIPTKVWAWGIAKLPSNRGKRKAKVVFGKDIESFINYFKEISDKHPTIYFHNAKFDVMFLLHYLYNNGYHWVQSRTDAIDNTITGIVNGNREFVTIDIYFKVEYDDNGDKITNKIRILDSTKLFNKSLSELADTFNLPYRKGCIDYDRHNVDCEITDEEYQYLENDVQILRDIIWQARRMGLTKPTISSCAMRSYKNHIGTKTFGQLFNINNDMDCEIRKAYRSGYNYLNPDYANVDIGEGLVFDCNSLYSYIMHDKMLPYGYPKAFSGQYEYDERYPLYVQHLSVKCKLLPNHIPAIQLKFGIKHHEYLTTSDLVRNNKDGYIELYLCNTDIELLFKHYEIEDIEYLGGYKFKQRNDLFRGWIDEWISLKIQAELEGNMGMRYICKTIPNALSGKFATQPTAHNKYPYLNPETNIIEFLPCEYELFDIDGNPIVDEETGEIRTTDESAIDLIYCPIGVFITAYGRYETVSLAQTIHEESIIKCGKSRYIYSDTDSLHIVGTDIPDCINVHPTQLGYWKLESHFERAKYLATKKYLLDNYTGLKNGYGDDITVYKVVVAGMPHKLHSKINWYNFKSGQEIDGMLKPKNVIGGVILKPTKYVI